MKQYPEIPRVENAPDDLFERGHLWLQEKVDGAHVRFQLDETGLIRFGDRDRVFPTDGVPEPYRHAVRHVRERLDREALRSALDDTESVVFFGEATSRQAIDYDWERTPSFLGFDVWSGERYLPPDAVEKIYDRLGFQPVNTFQKEVRAADFDPASYEIPTSNWYDGPAEGVIVRNKTGDRATLLHPDFEEVDDPEPIEGDADEIARQFVTRRRLELIADGLADRRQVVTVDALYERTVEDVFREEYGRLFHDRSDVDLGEFRSEVARLVGEFVDERH